MSVRSWQAEREAAVRWLRWQASRDDASGNDHEARLVRGLARLIEQGRHVMEGPPQHVSAESSGAAALLGSLGRGESKRRDVDYAALGKLGGKAGKGKKKPRRKS